MGLHHQLSHPPHHGLHALHAFQHLSNLDGTGVVAVLSGT
jgi:hypothetical protein